jgi:hypothetical protein
MVDIKKAVVSCLLDTLAIILSEKKFKRAVRFNERKGRLFYSFLKVECLEMMPP